MGIYVEKRDKLAARIAELTKRISDDTAKKQELEEKLKEANRLAMAEEYNCKPRELDEIINAEHSLLQNFVQAVCPIKSCLKWQVFLLTIKARTLKAKMQIAQTAIVSMTVPMMMTRSLFTESPSPTMTKMPERSQGISP